MSESIFNLVPVEAEVYNKPSMYRSTHHPKAELAGSTIGIQGTTQLPGAGKALKKSFSNFGPQTSARPDPGIFLKSGQRSLATTRAPLDPTQGPFLYGAEGRKPTVPRREEKPVYGLKSNKNFITTNAVEAILQVPQRSTEVEADYLAKADFGKVPEYLGQVKEEIRRENEMIDAYVAEMAGGGQGADEGPAMDRMSDEERVQLLKSLKAKWDSVNAKYQKMCHMVKLDTVGKVKRKESMEKELDTLEADIKRLAQRGEVYVAPY